MTSSEDVSQHKHDKEQEEQHHDMYSSEANAILSETVATVKYVIMCTVCGSFSYSSLYSIWYLYARQFNDSTTHSIVFVLYGAYIFACIHVLVSSSLSDKFGYGKVVTFLLLMQTIGVLGQSLATNFAVLSIFFVFGENYILAISLAYIAWILPHQYSVQYTSHLFSFTVVGYLLGPVISGVCSNFIGYNSVFWINFIINVGVLAFAFKFVFTSQNKLEQQQLTLKQEFHELNVSPDYIFPIINYEKGDDTLNWC
eukprot:388075_1